MHVYIYKEANKKMDWKGKGQRPKANGVVEPLFNSNSTPTNIYANALG